MRSGERPVATDALNKPEPSPHQVRHNPVRSIFTQKSGVDFHQDEGRAIGDEAQLMTHQIRLRPFDVADQGEAIEASFIQDLTKGNRWDGYLSAELAIEPASDEARIDIESDRGGAVRQCRIDDPELAVVQIAVSFQERGHRGSRLHHNVSIRASELPVRQAGDHTKTTAKLNDGKTGWQMAVQESALLKFVFPEPKGGLVTRRDRRAINTEF